MTRKYLILFFISIIMADTHIVPDEYASIQDAIDASDANDTILVSPGVYNENISFDGRPIVISSRYLIDNDSLLVGLTIIDGQQDQSVVTFSNFETSNSILMGLTLQNGIGNNEDPDNNGSFYTYGGGIYCENSSPLIKDCIIQNNTANEGGGGGIFCYNSSPRFEGCVINNNETDDVGGGLYSRSGSSPEFYDCTFSGNIAEFGAGCYLRNESVPIMADVIFNQNTANNAGGGLSLKDDADLQASNVLIINNVAEGLGGGFYVNNADPVLSYCLLAGNIASSGGGAYLRNSSEIDFINTTMANNTAGLYGGGIYIRDGVEVGLLNTIVWDNGDPGIHFRTEGESVTMNVDYSTIQYGQNGVAVNDNGQLNWGEGNLDEEPYFCSSDNFYIRENSPCLTSGQNGTLIGCFGAGCGPLNLGPIWYVDSNGDNDSDGSFETPFLTISRAIEVSSDGDTIKLTPGVYTESLDFNYKQIVLESMIYTNPDNINAVEQTWFAPGPLGGNCLALIGPSNNGAIIRGISFRGGSDPSGGGVAIINCSPTLVDIVLEENTADIGGGIYMSGSNANLKNITVRGNGANIGGGIYATDGEPTLDGILVEGNVAYWGAGIYFENSQPYLAYSLIRGNEAFIEGGGIYQSGGESIIEWTSFENNNGFDYGAGVVAYQTAIEANQITVAGYSSGIGSFVASYSSVISIRNSILWGNNGTLIYAPEAAGVSYFDVSYSDIDGGDELLANISNVIFNTQGGNINVDPLFCLSDSSFYGLQLASSCLTASDSSGVIGAFDSYCETLTLEDELMPNEFLTLSNYPNPFNPTTNIVYELISDEFFTLLIYDLNGNLIRNLKAQNGRSGIFSTKWDSKSDCGQKVSSGTYYVKLTQGEKTSTRSVTLIK